MSKRSRISGSKYAVTSGKVRRPSARTTSLLRGRLAAANASLRVARARQVRGTGRERKTYDPVTLFTNILRISTDSAVAVSATSYITNGSSAMVLNQVPQGTTSTSRIGRKIKMTGIRICGRFVNTATSAQYNQCRLCLVYIPRLDRGTTTMPPQNVIWTTQSASALRVIDNSDRFRVIRQWTVDLFGDIDAVNTGAEAQSFDEMVKLNHQTVWLQSNTNGSFNDMEEGALCLYAQGTNTDASNLYASFAFSARLYFDDL